jgi:hypothetical protein
MVQQLGSIVAATPPLKIGRHSTARVVPRSPRPFATIRRALELAVPGVPDSVRLAALVRCDFSVDDIAHRSIVATGLLRARFALAAALAAGHSALILDKMFDRLDSKQTLALAETIRRLQADGIAFYIACRSEEHARMLLPLIDATVVPAAARLNDHAVAVARAHGRGLVAEDSSAV